MLMHYDDMPTVWVHRNEDGTLRQEYNFDVTKPLPWGRPVVLSWCQDCFAQAPAAFDAAGAVVDVIHAELDAAHVKSAAERIASGEAVMTEADVLAKAKFGHTHLQKLRNERRFPPASWMAGRNVWAEGDVTAAIAKIIADDTASKSRRVAPPNRHVKARAAGGK